MALGRDALREQLLRKHKQERRIHAGTSRGGGRLAGRTGQPNAFEESGLILYVTRLVMRDARAASKRKSWVSLRQKNYLKADVISDTPEVVT